MKSLLEFGSWLSGEKRREDLKAMAVDRQLVVSPDILYYARALSTFPFCDSVLPLGILVKFSTVDQGIFIYASLVLCINVRKSATII